MHHISCSSALKDITNCSYIMHKNAPAKCADIKITKDLQKELLPGILFEFIYTPGHTNDSMSIKIKGLLFTGDVLFLDDGGAGRDDLPGGSPGKHWESLQKIGKLPGSIMIYPSHDYRNRKPSTLNQQKVTNPYLKKRSKIEFIHYVEDLKLGPADWMKDVLKANYTCAQDPNVAWIPIDTPSCEVKGTLDKNANEQVVDYITKEELLMKMKNNFDSIFLIDVREPKELVGKLGHIQGVQNIPLLEIPKQIKKIKEIKDKEIILICRSGSRAYTAGQLLQQAGLTNIRVLEKGMIGWVSNKFHHSITK